MQLIRRKLHRHQKTNQSITGLRPFMNQRMPNKCNETTIDGQVATWKARKLRSIRRHVREFPGRFLLNFHGVPCGDKYWALVIELGKLNLALLAFSVSFVLHWHLSVNEWTESVIHYFGRITSIVTENKWIHKKSLKR